jgi:hypothetical protein
MNAEPRLSRPLIGVAADDAVLPLLLLLVQRTVLEVANTDRRRLVERELALGAMVDVTVEVIDAKRPTPLLVELLEVRTPSH